MQLGRVAGSLVASVKDPAIAGYALLVVEPLDRHLAPAGAAFIAIDALSTAGVGDLVYVVGSREAEQALPGVVEAPIDMAIVGIVDAVRPCGGSGR